MASDSIPLKDDLREYIELYERARTATKEAERQGNAQLKVALAAVAACRASDMGQKSTIKPSKLYAIPFMFQFFVRMATLCLLFQRKETHRTAVIQEDVPLVLLPLTNVWVFAAYVSTPVVYFLYSSWFRDAQNVILLAVSFSLWLGEVASVRASLSVESTQNLILVLLQCILMSMLYRFPFWMQLKTRILGFGLQMLGMFAMGIKENDAVLTIFYFSVGHLFAATLAYALEHISKSCNDPPVCPRQEAPRRALGGFAGGFAGVSSLKCDYPPLWTLSSSYSMHDEGEISDASCGSSFWLENPDGEVSS